MKQKYLIATLILTGLFLIGHPLGIEFPGSTLLYFTILMNNLLASYLLYRGKL